VSIIECDMDVDFSAPVGYVEPKPAEKAQNENGTTYDDPNTFTPFSGLGNRLDGKEPEPVSPTPGTHTGRRGYPDTAWQFGTLKFFHPTNSSNGSGASLWSERILMIT